MLNISINKAALADKAHDVNRSNYIRETLSLSAGIYRDKQISKQLGIQKAVLINVVEYNKDSGQFSSSTIFIFAASDQKA